MSKGNAPYKPCTQAGRLSFTVLTVTFTSKSNKYSGDRFKEASYSQNAAIRIFSQEQQGRLKIEFTLFNLC